MASRDLTLDYVQLRKTAKRHRLNSLYTDQDNKPRKTSKPAALFDEELVVQNKIQEELKSSPNRIRVLRPNWANDVDTIHNIISDINCLIELLGSLHTSRVGTVFGNDFDDMEARIDNITKDLTSKFYQAECLLNSVGSVTRKSGGKEVTIGRNIQRSLAKKLQELSINFRQTQRKYLSNVQALRDCAFTETESKFGINLNEKDREYVFSENQSVLVEDLHEVVTSRDKEISQITKSTEELSAIFKELAVLVIDQGTIIDRIDYNMETVVEHTKEGIQQLQIAQRHQKSSRPKKCIFCLSFIIIFLSIILILKQIGRAHV